MLANVSIQPRLSQAELIENEEIAKAIQVKVIDHAMNMLFCCNEINPRALKAVGGIRRQARAGLAGLRLPDDCLRALGMADVDELQAQFLRAIREERDRFDDMNPSQIVLHVIFAAAQLLQQSRQSAPIASDEPASHDMLVA